MEHDNGDNHNWPVQRREEGLVNKHMADIARESLQQRLCAGEMHSLTERGSRRSGEEFTDEPRRRDVSFGEEPPLSTACSSGADKLLSSPPSTETAAQGKIIALLVEIKEEQQRQTLEQLDEMERQLEETGSQKRMVSYLSRMGGATVDDAVRRLMQSVLTFAVGSELNWVGRGRKRSFRNTRLQGVLFCALKRTPVGKEATHHQYADVVKKWLRFAPFRQGGGGRRCYRAPVEFADSEETDNSNQSSTR
ncbi:hypothetical protein JOQ06_020644 [Pogonophryne albipinna]|uniref:DUF4806 domain-containing protein n=1 Tax=Pogonophryne albipinna TaxID=1090488 RepID=A0AAD6BUN4_9TELE|nr:hypothetical protein JOQ06_020644 [Pogonophryne albipinna]